MTVKDVFELRKQGKIEEAYEAIRSMYATHQGKYTSIAMFWTAHDILKKRVGEGKMDEANKIYLAMERMAPKVEDTEGRVGMALQQDKKRVAEASQNFCGAISTPTDEKARLGEWGEQVAMDFLRKKGYVILHHDWQSGHRDIDIIAKDGDTLVFVEVKSRRNNIFREPEEAVDKEKMQSLRRSMNHYIKTNQYENEYRLDIITVTGAIGEEAEIKHLEDVSVG